MRIFLDTEFIENGRTIDLISIGLVDENGLGYYAESAECDMAHASPWVRQNVIPHLKGGRSSIPRAIIAAEIVRFAGPKPEFWAYYADYDWVALCQIYGTMMQLPKGWPKFCMDVKQLCVSVGDPCLPEQVSAEHNALNDAVWTKAAYEFLQKPLTQQGTGDAS